jgi:hypothetical protein
MSLCVCHLRLFDNDKTIVLSRYILAGYKSVYVIKIIPSHYFKNCNEFKCLNYFLKFYCLNFDLISVFYFLARGTYSSWETLLSN